MFALTRTHIINDDLGAFGDMRTRIGRGAAKKFNKVFWTAFINNSDLLHRRPDELHHRGDDQPRDRRRRPGPGGPQGVPEDDDPDGRRDDSASTSTPTPRTRSAANPGGRPEILLVPPELEGNGRGPVPEPEPRAVSGASANIYANKYRPVVAWQLSDSGLHRVLDDRLVPAQQPRLPADDGRQLPQRQQAPTVESADADFDQLGVQFRGYHDFGCDQAEYLGGVKSKGAA
jgi:hypothetical protein